MPAETENEEVKGATPGAMLTIWVHFGLEEVAAGSVVADTLAALRDEIKAKFFDEIKKVPAPHKLIVQSKDVANNPHPLKNDPELVLEGVLNPDEEGNYDVYVEVVETARHLSTPEVFFFVREPGFRAQFLALLETRPNTRVVISGATWQRLAERYSFQAVAALDDQDVDRAHEILQAATVVLRSSNTAAALENSGLSIASRPLANYESTSSDFYAGASRSSGQLLIFKISHHPDFAREIAICKELALEENKVPGLMRISVTRIQIRQEEKRTQVEALVMPIMGVSLLRMGKFDSAALLRRSESIVAGLNWLHERGYVHMDVNASNILVNVSGDWFLADFGACVRVGEHVQGTTTPWGYPKPINGEPSRFEFDWYMFAVALLAHECLPFDLILVDSRLPTFKPGKLIFKPGPLKVGKCQWSMMQRFESQLPKLNTSHFVNDCK